MVLSEGHRAGVVPAVDNLGRAVHHSSALRTTERYRVNVGLMKLDIALDTATLFKLGFRADRLGLATVVANPNGQGRTPVSFTRKSPVDNVFKEVTHSAVLNCFGHPVDRVIRFDKFVFYGGHLDKPARPCIIK